MTYQDCVHLNGWLRLTAWEVGFELGETTGGAAIRASDVHAWTTRWDPNDSAIVLLAKGGKFVITFTDDVDGSRQAEMLDMLEQVLSVPKPGTYIERDL